MFFLSQANIPTYNAGLYFGRLFNSKKHRKSTRPLFCCKYCDGVAIHKYLDTTINVNVFLKLQLYDQYFTIKYSI